MELEFQLLDAKTFDLVDGILPLMQLFPDNPYIKPEFIQNTVEVASKVCYGIDELEAHVKGIVAELVAKCQTLGMKLCGAGTHPFSQQMAILTPFPRYLHMQETEGYLSHVQITFATHVHIGMRSAAEALHTMADLKPYLPLLIALSANSPFWRGYDTGHACYRHRILAATRSYGIPPTFSDWSEFCAFVATTRRAGIFETINDIHWDIRPRPHLGTLEIKVLDAQPTVTRAIILANFVHMLVDYLHHTNISNRPATLPQPAPWWIEKINHYQASKPGLEAQYIINEQGQILSLAKVFKDVIDILGSYSTTLNQIGYLEQLKTNVSNVTPYTHQRTVYSETGTLQGVVADLVADLEHEVKQYQQPIS